MIDAFINAIMFVGAMFMVITAFWAILILPFFYIWYIPTFITCAWAVWKKKGWKIPLLAFAMNTTATWLATLVILANVRW